MMLAALASPADPEEGFRNGAHLRLKASRCPRCDRTDVPAREHCAACDVPTESLSLSTVGTLRLASSVLHPPPDALIPTPYHVGVATFDGRRSVMGLLISEASQRLGHDVETVAYEYAPGRLTYAFRLCEPAEPCKHVPSRRKLDC